jgi:hypothetical protein
MCYTYRGFKFRSLGLWELELLGAIDYQEYDLGLWELELLGAIDYQEYDLGVVMIRDYIKFFDCYATLKVLKFVAFDRNLHIGLSLSSGDRH